MTDFAALLGKNFRSHLPASSAEVAQLNTAFGGQLPEDYKDFFAWSDGGEGGVGELYISIWTIKQVIDLNAQYAISKRLGKKFVGIGTDGGDYCFAVDLDAQARFVVVPLGALAVVEVKFLAINFVEGLTKIRNGDITGDNF